jgi:hypothetical protein
MRESPVTSDGGRAFVWTISPKRRYRIGNARMKDVLRILTVSVVLGRAPGRVFFTTQSIARMAREPLTSFTAIVARVHIAPITRDRLDL